MPQLIQYLCPSWRLSLYGRPSALSRWSDRPVLQYDRAQLFRLNAEEEPSESLIWEGTAQELQDLQDILQNYIQDLLQRSHQAFLAGEKRELGSQGTVAAAGVGVEVQSDLAVDVGTDITAEPQQARAADPHDYHPPQGTTLPVMRVEAVGVMGHRLCLPPDLTFSLSTLDCFDLAEVLDQWQAETLNLPPLLHPVAPKTPPAWLKTAALILMTIGASSSVSLLGMQWWQQQQGAQFETASSQADSPQASAPQASAPDLTLDELTALPNLQDGSPYTPIPRLPSEIYGPRLPSEVYGPPPPGQPDVFLGLELDGSRPLPSGEFAGLPMPPPPDFSALPPPPPGYSVPSSAEPYRTYAPDPDYREPSRPYNNNSYNNNSYNNDAMDQGDRYSDPSSESAALPAPSLNSRSAPLSAAVAPVAPSSAASESVAVLAEGDRAARMGDIASYFQGRWQPPDTLSGSLEYQLFIGSDGTLQAISPLSDRAGNFIDRTGIPLLGEPLTSPGAELRVTIVFYADGGVEVF